MGHSTQVQSCMKLMMRPLTTNTKPIKRCRMNRLFIHASKPMTDSPVHSHTHTHSHTTHTLTAQWVLLYNPLLHGPSLSTTDLAMKFHRLCASSEFCKDTVTRERLRKRDTQREKEQVGKERVELCPPANNARAKINFGTRPK